MSSAIGEIEKLKALLTRAEDKNRWERRAPLVPEDLREIPKDTDARAFVEKSEKRIFCEDQYTASGAIFDRQEYYRHPERYESRFEQFLPSFALLVNAVYWEKRYPRFLTWAGLKHMAESMPAPRLSGGPVARDQKGGPRL
jgi:hypothetical protein